MAPHKFSLPRKQLSIACILVSIFIIFVIVIFNVTSVVSVSISTTAEAFIGPPPGVSLIQRANGKIILSLGNTPAPWPKEAKKIYDAAKKGKTVHITLMDGDRRIYFDVVGLSSDGLYLVECKSEDDAKKLLEALKLNNNRYI